MTSSSLVTLRARVDSGFWAAHPRSWPDPHPQGQSPPEDEYSRCLDPGKYVTGQQRARAWASVLVDVGAATMTSWGSRDLPPWGTVDTTALTPTRRDCQPMFLHFSSGHLPGVIVAFGHPKVILARQPACGCDACDEGSEALIEAIDDAVESVVCGAALIDQGHRSVRVVTLHGETTSSRIDPDPDRVIGRWNGAPWLD